MNVKHDTSLHHQLGLDLQELARKLDRLNPDAANSLREGLEETITINRLGIGGTLARTLGTTDDIVNVSGRRVSVASGRRRSRRHVRRGRLSLSLGRVAL